MPADTEINDELIAERRQGAVGSTPADMAPLAAFWCRGLTAPCCLSDGW